MAVTSKDIAKLCKVSQGTVDRALNNRSGISPATKKKILDTAAKLGYRPHLLARSLAKGSTMTIGIVVFDLNNYFFAQLVNEIETYARKEGYFTYLTLTNKDMNEEKSCIDHLIDRHVDGLILCSVNKGEGYEKYLKSLKVPVTTIGNRISSRFPFVGIDDYSAMKDATKYVIAKGYSRIIYVSPPLINRNKVNLHAQEQRLFGFQDVLKEAGSGIEHMILGTRDYMERIDFIINNPHGRTAVLCSNDIYALEILNYCYEKNIKVPESLGLIGFDNINVLRYVRPSLATVEYPLEELGEKAVKCLIRQIQGEETLENIYLDHRIIDGDSL